MLVRKCDVCGHIIEDKDGYITDILEVRSRIPNTSFASKTFILEICSECKQAIFSVLNERSTKKEQEEEK